MRAKISDRQVGNDKRITHIVIPVNEQEYNIFTKVIREYHHDLFARYIRALIVDEYNELKKKGMME